jgi:hypothetical protein
MLHRIRLSKSLGATADTDADKSVLLLLQVMPVVSEVNCGVSKRILMVTDPLLLCTKALQGGGESMEGNALRVECISESNLRLKPNTAPSKCKPRLTWVAPSAAAMAAGGRVGGDDIAGLPICGASNMRVGRDRRIVCTILQLYRMRALVFCCGPKAPLQPPRQIGGRWRALVELFQQRSSGVPELKIFKKHALVIELVLGSKPRVKKDRV